jgi:hypothetical protein
MNHCGLAEESQESQNPQDPTVTSLEQGGGPRLMPTPPLALRSAGQGLDHDQVHKIRDRGGRC